MAGVTAGAAAGKENAAKKQKGSKGYPKGVIETGRNTIKHQARVSYKPDGGKTVQRSAGTFDTPEEAALQMAAYFTRRSLLKALTLGMERRFTLSTSEARPFPCFRHGTTAV